MEEETEMDGSLLRRAYFAAKEGMSMSLYVMLSDKPAEMSNRLVSQELLQSDGQCCSAFIAAARFGQTKVVKMLLEKFQVDIEQEGRVKFDGYIIEGASALWCAAGVGHLSVVKTLLKAGANVNHPTKTNSTPVRAACFDGRLDIVKYLTEHSANIHIANKNNNSCLMIAAYKGHLDIVSFLLEHGAQPNERAQHGETALHFAAECGHCNVVKELLKHGAKMSRSAKNMSPLISAAERAKAEIVECLVQSQELRKEEVIEAYELLGASFANDKDHYCLRKAYHYLRKAMLLRFSDPENVVAKPLGEPIAAYEHWRESETVQRLEAIRNSSNALHMESLAIRERILGLKVHYSLDCCSNRAMIPGRRNPDVPQPVIYRGAVFADNARFDRCIDLWLHALNLRQFNNMPISKDLLRFAQVFSQMIHLGVQVQFSQVLDVLQASLLALEVHRKNLLEPQQPKDDADQSAAEEIESNLTTTLYILAILTKLMTLNEKGYSQADIKKAHHMVQKLCALQMTLKDGQMLLHLAVNADTPVDDFHTSDVCKFPCAATAKLLIQCGANVNAMDTERNTPLHIIVQYEKPISDFLTLHSIILDLVEAGAHMDIVNSQGKTPFNAATTGVAEIILRTQTKLSLKCMAAQAVKAYNLSYSGNVPRSLESFIELHGPGLNQG